jgi:hypothetical protein
MASETMGPLKRIATALAIGAAAAPPLMFAMLAGTAAASPSGVTLTPFAEKQRRCDHSSGMFTPARGFGRGFALISRASTSEVAAEVRLETARPGTSYFATLIQTPRPSSAPCRPGDPGVAFGVLNTDAGGNASVSLRGPIQPGATGAWVNVELPAEFSQTPLEYYTSDFVAAI